MAPADSTSPVAGDASAAGTPEQLAVNLQVVSPSVGVNRPLLFPGLPATTTLKQLKERIRQELPLRPADDHQRLIHRGRAYGRETDTLLDVLGEAAFRSNEQQTMHLVLKEAPGNPTTTTTTDTRGRSPAPVPQPPGTQRPILPHPQLSSQPPSGFPRRNPVQPVPGGPFPAPGTASPAPVAPPNVDPGSTLQQHQQNMTNWLTQLQRESRTRAMVNQNQRARAMMGMRGIGDNGGHAQEPSSGRASPALGHYYREAVGPNGQTYQLETVIRGSAPGQAGAAGGLSPAEVQSILRSADMSQATNAMATAMHRSASGASVHSLHGGRPFSQPGVTAPALSRSESRAPSGRATPDVGGARSASGGSATANVGGSSSQPPTRQNVDVYILSSPEGPRGLLVNNSTSETYYTPRLTTPAGHPLLRNLVSPVSLAPGAATTQARAEVPNTPFAEQQHQQRQRQQPQGQEPNRHAGQAQPPPLPDGQDDPDNPNEPGLPPLLLQVWPHIWLLFRLALFVWFFTSPQASWGRWFSVLGLAIFIFILSVGALHGVADFARRPIAQQLENAVPRLEPHHAVRPGGRGPVGGDHRNPDPAEMAARLVAQREQENWLQGQLRRLERAGLLFLASIAPGVAERHIANLEAEARAERQRREAEAEAAEAERRRRREEDEAAAAAAAAEGESAAQPQPPAGEEDPANREAAQPNAVAT